MGDSAGEIEHPIDETGSRRPQKRVYELLLERRTKRGDDEEQRAEADHHEAAASCDHRVATARAALRLGQRPRR